MRGRLWQACRRKLFLGITAGAAVALLIGLGCRLALHPRLPQFVTVRFDDRAREWTVILVDGAAPVHERIVDSHPDFARVEVPTAWERTLDGLGIGRSVLLCYFIPISDDAEAFRRRASGSECRLVRDDDPEPPPNAYEFK